MIIKNKYLDKALIYRCTLIVGLLSCASLSGCSDPKIYGSIGVSSGFGGYGGYHSYPGGNRMHGSISIGGRIR